jgi:hypothetical protein
MKVSNKILALFLYCLSGEASTAADNNILYVDGTKYALTTAGVNQAVSDANAQGGGKVIISKPINTNANITLASKVTLECTGWATAPLTWTGGAGPNAMFIVPNGSTDVVIRGCSGVGPNATVSGGGDVRGVEMDGCTRCVVELNRFTGMTYGIFGTQNPNNDIWVQNNSLFTETTQGIVGYGSNWHITGNRIDAIGTTNLHHGIYVSGIIGADVSMNNISNTAGLCVHVFTAASGHNNDDIRVVANSCSNAGKGAGSTNGGMLATFQSPSTFCRKIWFIGNNIDTVTGNNVDVGIEIGSCTDSGIQGGTIKNVASHGILITGGVTDSVVSGVRIKDYNANGTGATGIVLGGGSLRNVVSSNVISASNFNGSPTGIQVAGAADNIVSANVLLNNTIPITDNGTRTEIYGNKINNTDATFRVPGSVAIGGGSTINAIYSGSGTLTYAAISAQTCQERTLTITGVSTTNFGVSCAPRATLGNSNLSWSSWVSASNTVSVRVCNPSSGNITPLAVTWACNEQQ